MGHHCDIADVPVIGAGASGVAAFLAAAGAGGFL